MVFGVVGEGVVVGEDIGGAVVVFGRVGEDGGDGVVVDKFVLSLFFFVVVVVFGVRIVIFGEGIILVEVDVGFIDGI